MRANRGTLGGVLLELNMASFITDPQLFEQEFQKEYSRRQDGFTDMRRIKAFLELLTRVPEADKNTVLDTVVVWLNNQRDAKIVDNLISLQTCNLPHWGWSGISLGVRLLDHSNDLNLITLGDKFNSFNNVFERGQTMIDLILMGRVDLLEPIFSQLRWDWLHDDMANSYTLKTCFKTAENAGVLEDVYNVLRTQYSFRWTSCLLDGPMAHVQLILNDPKFQKWSKTFDYFAGLYNDQINTLNAYTCLKENNLFDTFGVDRQTLAVRTFASILWDPPEECTEDHKPHYAAAIGLIDETYPGVEQARFFEQFGALVEERTNNISYNIGDNSFFTPEDLADKYFTTHFLDFFERYRWDTTTAQHILSSSSWFLNIPAFRATAPLQTALLHLHIEKSDTIPSKIRKI